jgi:hypothetical protein
MDEQSSLIIPILFGVTAVLALALVIWTGMRARRAKREHHHSVSERQARGEVPKTWGAGDTRD